MAKVFSEGEEARIEQIIEDVIPEEMKKCSAHRIFNDKDNVKSFFESLNDIKLLVRELKEHKDSHKTIKEEMDKIKKYKWIHRGFAFLGAGFGAFIAMLVEKKLKGP